jgi:hypothetical protein
MPIIKSRPTLKKMLPLERKTNASIMKMRDLNASQITTLYITELELLKRELADSRQRLEEAKRHVNRLKERH